MTKPRWTQAATTLLLLACVPAEEASLGACTDPAPWHALMATHLARYPDMQMADALKLMQQAATGSEHVVRDSAGAGAYMQREWDTLGEGPMEPVVDTLGRGSRFARVHLRPYQAAGGAPDQLTAAFVATARATPDTALLGCALRAVSSVVPWDSLAWHNTVERWRGEGYPAMHHSEVYTERYRPAYRVVGIERAALLRSTP